MKKAMSLILSIIIISLMIPTNIFAGAEVLYSGKAGPTSYWSLDSLGVFRITGSGETYNEFGNLPWQEYKEDIKIAIIGEGITALHQQAFQGARNMTELTLPSTLTAITGNVAFDFCYKLEKVHISDLDAWCRIEFSLINYQQACCPLFNGATLLLDGEEITEITIPDGVTTLWSYQYSIPTLEKLTIPASVKTVATKALYKCEDTEIHIPDLSCWLDIDFRLFNNGPLDNATLYIDGEPLTSLTMPDGVTEVKKSAFQGYDKLTYLDLNDVSYVGEYAFSECRGLAVLDMSDVSVLDYDCFNCCDGLKEIYISDNITEMDSYSIEVGDCFEKLHISDLYQFCVGNHNFSNLYYGENTGIYLNGELLTQLEVPEGVESLKGGIFSGYEKLESVKLPEGVTTIENSAFRSCSNLKNIALPNSLRSIGESAFEYSGLTDINIPDNVEEIARNAFAGCDELQTVVLGGKLKSIGDSAFYCGEIGGALTLPEGIETIGAYAFYGNNIAEAYLPNTLISIGEKAFESNEDLVILCHIGSYADSYAEENNIPVKYMTQCQSVTVNTLPEKLQYSLNEDLDLSGLTLEVKYDDGRSEVVDKGYCVTEYDLSTPGKKTITIELMDQRVCFEIEVFLRGQCSENVSWSISDGVFTLYGTGEAEIDNENNPFEPYKDEVREIVIGDGITSVGYRFFSDFANVTSLVLPESVKSVGSMAFSDCSSLADVTFLGAPEVVEEWAFERCENIKNVYIGSLENWFNIEFCNSTANPLRYAGNLYVNSERLSNVTVPDGVTVIYPCALDFDFLKKVTIPSSVTEIRGYAFRGCDELTSLVIPSSVTKIHEDAFYECDKLFIRCPVGAYAAVFAHENEIPYEYIDKVEGVGVAKLPDKLDYLSYDEVDFTGLVLEIAFENGVVIETDHNYTVGEYVLDLVGENEITVYYKDKAATFTVNVENGDILWQEQCGQDVNWSLYESGQLRIYGEGAVEDTPWLEYRSNIKVVVIEEGVTALPDSAFTYCDSLSAIHIPKTLERTGVSLFEGSPFLEKVYITDLSAYCRIQFPHVLANPLCFGGSLILNKTPLTDLVIPEGIEAINDNHFYNADCFDSVTLPSTLKYIGQFAFSNMDEITKIHIPDSVTEISNFAFMGCSLLAELSGGRGVRSVGMSAFEGTPFIKGDEVYVGDILISADRTAKGIYDVEYGTKNIGMNCFMGSERITLIILPNTVEKISWGAFNDCPKLKEVLIPESVTEIDITAFDKPYVTIRCKKGSYAAEFAEIFSIPYVYYETKNYTDVKKDAWYTDAVEYCTVKGYITGMNDTSFAPNSALKREQFVMILSQVAGVDTTEFKYMDDGFIDTKAGMWYSGAIYWAVNEGYVSGISDDKFGLGKDITREQLARLFYLYAESVGMDVTSRADLSEFSDQSKISGWAADQIKWAVSVGLISGTSSTTLSPKSTATRAQAARIFMLFDGIS